MANYNIPPSKMRGGAGQRSAQAEEHRGRKRAVKSASRQHPRDILKARRKRTSGSNGG